LYCTIPVSASLYVALMGLWVERMRRIGGGCRLKLCGSHNAFCTYEKDVKLVITFREANSSAAQCECENTNG
jgi:hypothetical protein